MSATVALQRNLGNRPAWTHGPRRVLHEVVRLFATVRAAARVSAAFEAGRAPAEHDLAVLGLADVKGLRELALRNS